MAGFRKVAGKTGTTSRRGQAAVSRGKPRPGSGAATLYGKQAPRVNTARGRAGNMGALNSNLPSQ